MPRDQEFLQYLILAIASEKDAVEIVRKIDDKGVLLVVKVAKSDMGRVVGKQGQTIQAMRTLVRVVGSQNPDPKEQRVSILLEDESGN